MQETRECYYCKKRGHLKENCRYLKAKQKSSNHPSYPKKNYNKAKTAINETCFKSSVNKVSSNNWYIDSGATSHMSNDKEFFTEFTSTVKDKITVADGKEITSYGIGDGYINCLISPTKTSKVQVKNVLYVPELDGNLLSVKKLAENGNVIIFKDDRCVIRNGNQVKALGQISEDLYKVSCQEKAYFSKNKEKNCIHVWHYRFGHINFETIEEMFKENMVHGLEIQKCNCKNDCESCIQGKLTRKPFKKQIDNRKGEILELIHTDLCGPMECETPGKKRYFLTFIDDYSRFTVLYLLNSKDELPLKLEEYMV